MSAEAGQSGRVGRGGRGRTDGAEVLGEAVPDEHAAAVDKQA